MIEFHHVQKTYRVSGRDVPALQSTDLRIEQGQVFGLIGHSGAGKSTLLRLINRLEEPSAGRILVAGEDVTALDATGLRRFRRIRPSRLAANWLQSWLTPTKSWPRWTAAWASFAPRFGSTILPTAS